MVKLRFSFDVEFDSQATALAFGVTLGSALAGATSNALALCRSTEPRIERTPITVTDIASDESCLTCH